MLSGDEMLMLDYCFRSTSWAIVVGVVDVVVVVVVAGNDENDDTPIKRLVYG